MVRDNGYHSVFSFIENGIRFLDQASAFLDGEIPESIAEDSSYELDPMAMEMEIVREEILREGEIPAGKVLSGFLFFPEFEENGYIMICIPLEDQVFQFVYNKIREQG